MLLIDDLLLGGLRFVLDKLATVVDQEMNDESRLHQTLMEAQMRFEMGEIDAEEFAGIEQTVIDRLREIRAEREAGTPSLTDEGVRLSSVEISGPDADVDIEMPGAAMTEVQDIKASSASKAIKASRALKEGKSFKQSQPRKRAASTTPRTASGRRRTRR